MLNLFKTVTIQKPNRPDFEWRLTGRYFCPDIFITSLDKMFFASNKNVLGSVDCTFLNQNKKMQVQHFFASYARQHTIQYSEHPKAGPSGFQMVISRTFFGSSFRIPFESRSEDFSH
jgi:hypothetical protein